MASSSPAARLLISHLDLTHIGHACEYIRIFHGIPDRLQLVLLSGYPSSGKTYRSEQIIKEFTKRIEQSEEPRIKRLKLHHIHDGNLGLSRDVYGSARPEKDARAAFTSAIKRHLSRDDIVIADGMNYIKGFRYQLYCDAKAVQTPNCVVHIGTPANKCREFNDAELEKGTGGYQREIFDNLVFRYEEPNGMNRWDAPLFTVPFEDAEAPCATIWEAMVGTDGKAKVVRANAATVMKPVSQSDILYELDKSTSEVIISITTWQQDHPGEGGGSVKIAGSDQMVNLPLTTIGSPQLQRLRRQFIQLNRQHTPERSRLKDLFIDYLNDTFEA